MFEEKHRLQVSPLPINNRWRWQVLLPTGAVLTSKGYYTTPAQAVSAGQRWMEVETAFSALNACLSQLCGERKIAQQEYCNLMTSFLKITQH